MLPTLLREYSAMVWLELRNYDLFHPGGHTHSAEGHCLRQKEENPALLGAAGVVIVTGAYAQIVQHAGSNDNKDGLLGGQYVDVASGTDPSRDQSHPQWWPFAGNAAFRSPLRAVRTSSCTCVRRKEPGPQRVPWIKKEVATSVIRVQVQAHNIRNCTEHSWKPDAKKKNEAA